MGEKNPTLSVAVRVQKETGAPEFVVDVNDDRLVLDEVSVEECSYDKAKCILTIKGLVVELGER